MTERVDKAVQCFRLGEYDEAEALCREALDGEPDNELALRLHADLAHRNGRHGEEIDDLSRLLKLAPCDAALHSNLGVALNKVRRADEAMAHLHQAIRLRPDFPQAHNNLGAALENLNCPDEAEAAYRQAISLKNDYAAAHHHLGKLLQRRGRFVEAIAAHRRAVQLRPDLVEAWWGLATVFSDIGELDQAIECHRHAVALRPQSPHALSNLLYVLHYHPDTTQRQLFAHHLRWSRHHAKPCYPVAPSASTSCLRASVPSCLPYYSQPTTHNSQLLRIGYISCDFRYHPVSRFFEPILANHDRERFRIFCYSSLPEPDAMTRRLREYGDDWRNIYPLSDAAAADRIRRDRIDILVDLMGHIGGHRLLVLARKPAPIQVTYLGYPDTTGLSTIDYRLTDSLHDPPGQTERYHPEELIRLDPCAWSWRPDENSPDITPLPALKTGYVTFAALNKLIKVTPQMIALWANLLQAVPGSWLKVLGGSGDEGGDSDSLVYDLFERHGVPIHRLILAARAPRLSYLCQYHDCDIALDTFPYNGHTTTCDALWMGLPVVSLCGKTHVQRAGLSVLTAVGLPDLVVSNGDDYLRRVIKLTENLHELAQMRRTMRQRMSQSVLLDGKGFTARLEAVYQRIWQRGSPSPQAAQVPPICLANPQPQNGAPTWQP